MIFKTSLDNLAKWVTIGVTLLFAVLITLGFISIIRDGERGVPIYTNIALILVYLIAYAFRPIHYKVSDNTLIIHRPFTDIKIDRNQIKNVELLDKEKTRWAVRTFGVGGLFGYYGKFFTSKLGSMTWYATRRNKTVLVQTINRKIILTPDEPEKFVANFNL